MYILRSPTAQTHISAKAPQPISLYQAGLREEILVIIIMDVRSSIWRQRGGRKDRHDI